MYEVHIGFMFVNLILWKEKTFKGELAFNFGEKLNYFRDLGSKSKYFQEAGDFFQGFGENSAFSGSKDHTPLGLQTMFQYQ